jgi:hypothetical protein
MWGRPALMLGCCVALAAAALPPGYEDELYCPPGACLIKKEVCALGAAREEGGEGGREGDPKTQTLTSEAHALTRMRRALWVPPFSACSPPDTHTLHIFPPSLNNKQKNETMIFPPSLPIPQGTNKPKQDPESTLNYNPRNPSLSACTAILHGSKSPELSLELNLKLNPLFWHAQPCSRAQRALN